MQVNARHQGRLARGYSGRILFFYGVHILPGTAAVIGCTHQLMGQEVLARCPRFTCRRMRSRPARPCRRWIDRTATASSSLAACGSPAMPMTATRMSKADGQESVSCEA
jgi:hypothetical protein